MLFTINNFTKLLVVASLFNGVVSSYSVAQTQSIASPNWWKKPAKSEAKKNHLTMNKMSANKIKQVKQEPIKHFLQLPKANQWQLVGESIGIASAKYQWNFAQTAYEIAVIRMNSKVPLKAVLSIWQDKVGLTPNSNTVSEMITTNHKQKLSLYTFNGSQKTILLAVHQGNKYTFFRLLSDTLMSEQAINQFKEDLKNVVIIR